MIGRDADLNGLLRLAGASAAGGAPAIVLVSGEAGIGKTRLLTEFRSWANRRATVAFATCMSFAPVPLGPAQMLLDTFGELVPVAMPEADEGSGAAQLRVFRRLLQTLRVAARTRPVVAVIDDLHWADTATLEFVQFLGAELTDERLIFVASYRAEDVERTPALDRVVSRLSRSSFVHRLTIRPLSGPAVAELVDAALADRERPPPDVLHQIRERSEGNPLFAEELLKSALDDHADPSSSSLRTLIADRTARMSPEEIRLLELAAVIGRRFSVAFLERLAEGATRADLMAFLRHAIAGHFLIEDRDAAGWFSFRHALVREAIVTPMLLVENRAAHLAIARALEAEPDADERITELSEHYWCAGARTECYPYARRAAERALAQFSYGEAAEHFDRALACAPDEAVDLLALHEGAARAHQVLGKVAEAQRNYAAAAELAERRGSDERAIDALLELALSLRRAGSSDQALEVIDRAEELERRTPSDPLRFAILARRAQLHFLVGSFGPAQRALCDAEPLIDAARPRDAYRFYHARAGLRSYLDGDYERAIEDSEYALGLARESGDHSTILGALTMVALHTLRARPTGVSIAAMENAMSFAERHGDVYQATITRNNYAQVLCSAGRLDDARAHLNVVLAEVHVPFAARVEIAKTTLDVALYLRDDVLLSRADALTMLERARTTVPMHVWAWLAGSVAGLHADAGRSAEAHATLEPLVAEFFDEEIKCILTLPIGAFGDRRQVEAIRPFVARHADSANRIIRAHAALFEAYVAARFGDVPSARRRAAAAASDFEALAAPLLEAEALVVLGEKRRALALMSACGARRLPRAIAKSATETERTKPLSRREREVAELAAAGNSTRAIAERLVIGERTVEAHLAAAYAKLGVSSRAALAANLEGEY